MPKQFPHYQSDADHPPLTLAQISERNANMIPLHRPPQNLDRTTSRKPGRNLKRTNPPAKPKRRRNDTIPRDQEVWRSWGVAPDDEGEERGLNRKNSGQRAQERDRTILHQSELLREERIKEGEKHAASTVQAYQDQDKDRANDQRDVRDEQLKTKQRRAVCLEIKMQSSQSNSVSTDPAATKAMARTTNDVKSDGISDEAQRQLYKAKNQARIAGQVEATQQPKLPDSSTTCRRCMKATPFFHNLHCNKNNSRRRLPQGCLTSW